MQCVGKQVGIGSAENDNILDGMLHGIRIKLDECLENVNMWSDVRLEACAAACDEEVLKVRKAKLSDVAEDMLLGHIDSYRAEFHRVLRATTQEDNLWQGIGIQLDECVENVNVWSEDRFRYCTAACDDEVGNVRRRNISAAVQENLLGLIHRYRVKIECLYRLATTNNMMNPRGSQLDECINNVIALGGDDGGSEKKKKKKKKSINKVVKDLRGKIKRIKL